MTKDEIIALIREHYDPEPKDWPRHRGWDDGAGDIAAIMLGRMSPRVLDKSECPKCGLTAESVLHRFCTHQPCPVKTAAHERKYGAVTLPHRTI